MNFGDETFITPPPAGRGIVERAQGMGIALEVETFDVGHVVSAVRWLEQGLLDAADADQPRLRRPRRDRRLAGGARRDAAPAAARDVLDRHLHRPPSPADARPGAAQGRAGNPHRARGRRLHQPRACWRRRTRPWSRWRSAWRGASAARSPPRTRRRSCCGLAEAPRSTGVRRSPGRRRRSRPARLGDPRGDPELGDRALRTRGYHATSMRALASEAQVQPAAIYHWYASKEAILVELQDDFMERLTERRGRRHGPPRPARPAPRGGRPRARRLPRHPPARGVRHRQRDPGAHGRPARGADRQARRLPGDVQRADPRRDPRRLAATPPTPTSPPTRSCSSAPGSRCGSTRPDRCSSSRSPSCTSSSCSAPCGLERS